MKIAIRSFAFVTLALSSVVACKYETNIVVDQAEVSVIVTGPEAGSLPTDSATADSTPTTDSSLDAVSPLEAASEASPDVVVVETAAEAAPDTSVSTAVWSFCNPYSDPATSAANGWYGGCCVTGGSFKSATTALPTQIIKGSGERVYYLSTNGKRYDFPTTATLSSWLGPWDANHIPQSDPTVCSSVVQIPDTLLASIMIGGNITFRPGTYVTGLVADPKRYAVAKGAVLRPLQSDALGTVIFFPAYYERIRLSPDAFLVNYTIGVTVNSETDYDPATEFATTIEADLAAAAVATPTP